MQRPYKIEEAHLQKKKKKYQKTNPEYKHLCFSKKEEHISSTLKSLLPITLLN